MNAEDVISKKKPAPKKKSAPSDEKGKVLVKMLQGASWTTGNKVTFTREEPFQLCDPFEAKTLVDNNPERFKESSREELRSFYGLEE